MPGPQIIRDNVRTQLKCGSVKLLVVIPALNEERSISNVISEIGKSLPDAELLVIDDGSTDETGSVARAAGAMVATHPFNLGVGAALRTGFRFAAENGHTHVVQIDADGQHDPEEVKKLLAKAEEAEIVIGSRFANEEFEFEVSGVRRLAMRWLAYGLSKITKTALSDVTSGFRVSKGPAIPLFAEEYPPEYLGDTVESLVIAHRAGMKIAEVPIQMRPREYGKPSQGTFKSLWYVGRATLVLIMALTHRQDTTVLSKISKSGS